MDHAKFSRAWRGAALLASLAASLAAGCAWAVTINEYPLPVSGAPQGMTVGPDANIWFTEPLANKIGKMTLSGVLSEFSLPTPNAQPLEITAGPDGNLWFTEFGTNKIGRITPAGLISEFALPTPGLASPWGISGGPDGNIWFTAYTGNAIGRITTASGTITAFPLPSGNSGPAGITSAAGSLWFTEFDGNRIGQITTAGVISEHAVPNPQTYPAPSSITVGPDGNLWFTERFGNKVVRMTTSWVFTEYAIPTGGSEPAGIFNGGNGLWFTEQVGNRLGVVLVSGTSAALYEVATSIPTAGSTPTGIAFDENGYVWFSETRGGKLGRYDDLSGTYLEYAIDPGPRRPYAITRVYADTWFTEPQANRIGRLTVNGSYTSVAEFTLPTAGALPWAITSVPGGWDIWFTEMSANKIGRITSDGVITEFPVPTAGSAPCAITAAPNGDAWFTECLGNKIGRLTPAGVLTEFPIPTPNSYPAAIVYAPLGGVWFTEVDGQKIGQALPPQGTIYEYAVPTSCGYSITYDKRDWNLWYTIDGTARIGRDDLNVGGITEITIPAAGVLPRGISGNAYGRKLWFADAGNNAIGRITAEGAFAEYPIPTPGASPQWTYSDSPGDVWFTEQGADKIGRLVLESLPQTYFVSKSGTGSGTVTSSPAGISCGPTCTADFPHGQSVSLTATASPGSVFTGWSDSCAFLGNPCTRLITISNEATAYFTGVRMTVAKSGAGGGTIVSNPAGIDCGGTCTYDFTSYVNQQITLTATAFLGSVFTGWTGEGCSGAGTCTVTMSQARTVTATFVPSGTGFHPITPCRVVDTRNPPGQYGGPALVAAATRPFTMSGVCGLPADATAVALNITVTNATTAGTLTIYPGTGAAPGTNAISFSTGKTRANNSIMGLAGGILSVLDNQPTGSVNLILDVSGYFR